MLHTAVQALRNFGRWRAQVMATKIGIVGNGCVLWHRLERVERNAWTFTEERVPVQEAVPCGESRG